MNSYIRLGYNQPKLGPSKPSLASICWARVEQFNVNVVSSFGSREG